MFRSSVRRIPSIKSALKKDVSLSKLVRCSAVLSSSNYKNFIFKNGESCIFGFELSKKNILHKFYSDYPQHHRVTLPALSPTMEYGTIVSWEKKEGDKLNEGDLLAEIETDKATMGYETPTEGYLAKIIIPAGTKNVPVGKLVCIIVEEESYVAAFKDYVDTGPPKSASGAAPSPPKPPEPPQPQPQSQPLPPPIPVSSVQPPVMTPPLKSGERVYASPLAKRLAAEKNISLEAIGKGTGIYGSITSHDLSRAAADVKPMISNVRSGDNFRDIGVTNLNTTAAKRFLASSQNIPHYYLSMDVNIDNITSLMNKFNKLLEKENVKVNMNDFIIKAAALSSKKVPEANSIWHENFIRQYYNVDVCIAVHTDGGLLTPVIYDADIKGLAAISAETKELATRAREGKLQPSDYEGGTICIFNLSNYTVKHFSAIINPPHACALSVGAVESRVIEDSNRPCGFKTSQIMPVTMSCDHRILDGAVGARWLTSFRQLIENPETMVL